MFAVVVPSSASSTIRRMTTGPARVSAEVRPTSAPRPIQRPRFGRSSAAKCATALVGRRRRPRQSVGLRRRPAANFLHRGRHRDVRPRPNAFAHRCRRSPGRRHRAATTRAGQSPTGGDEQQRRRSPLRSRGRRRCWPYEPVRQHARRWSRATRTPDGAAGCCRRSATSTATIVHVGQPSQSAIGAAAASEASEPCRLRHGRR